MKHRIVVLGAGYAGAFAAGNLARRLKPADTEITVVSADPYFVERMRLHQLASGQNIRMRPLADVFAGTGVRVRVARVTALDVESRTVTLDDGELSYDTLLYALGSTVADQGVPGVAEHAFHVCDRPSALRLRERLDGLGEGAHVLVVGEGLTGIETVTEIAESRPGLNVALAARGEPGDWLSPGARRHLREAERVPDVVGDVLDLAVLVVVGQDHGVALALEAPDLRDGLPGGRRVGVDQLEGHVLPPSSFSATAYAVVLPAPCGAMLV